MLSGPLPPILTLQYILNLILLLPKWMGHRFSKSSTPKKTPKSKGNNNKRTLAANSPVIGDDISIKSSGSRSGRIEKKKHSNKTSLSSHDSKRPRRDHQDSEDISLDQVNPKEEELVYKIEELIDRIRNNDPSLQELFIQNENFNLLSEDRAADLTIQLCDALRLNIHVKSFCITESKIGDDFAQELSNSLCENRSIQKLDLRGNEITTAGITCIAKMLENNSTLKELYISNQKQPFNEEDEDTILTAMGINTSLTHIDLKLDPKKQTWVEKRIASNLNNNVNNTQEPVLPQTSPLTLNGTRLKIMAVFSMNHISNDLDLSGDQEFISMTEFEKNSVIHCIEINPMIEILNLSNTFLTDSFVDSLLQVLPQNTSLKYLDISSNKITGEGLSKLASAIRSNKGLQELKVANQFSTRPSLQVEIALADALMSNQNLLGFDFHFDDVTCSERASQYLQRNIAKKGS